MKQTDPQFKLRLDEDLKAALTSAAKQNQRTLSAEIVARLQASFQPNIRWAPGGDVTRLTTGEPKSDDPGFELLVRAMQEALRRQKKEVDGG